jgi:hypothetical protein
MAAVEQDAVCTHCKKRMRAVPKRSFLGFPKFTCPSCSKIFLYPLTKGYRILYWVFIAIFSAISLAALLAGKIAFPGALVIVGAIAIAKDFSIKSQVALAEIDASEQDLDPDGLPPQV